MISLTNQSASATTNKQKDSRIRLKSFLGLPTEDILARLDHFDNVVSYHEWHKERKALELLTVLEHVVASTFIQQPEEIKQNWTYLHEQLMQHFTNNNATQLALWNNGENHGNRDIPLYNLRIQEEIRLQHSSDSVSATQCSRRPSSLSYGAVHTVLALSLFYSSAENSNYVMFCINSLFALGLFILIHHLGLFTNTALKDSFNPICRYSPESVSTNSTIVRIDLIIRPQLNRTIGLVFRSRPSCCQLIWSLLRLFLAFDIWLFLSRIVNSSHRRDIFLTKSPFTPMGEVGSSCSLLSNFESIHL